MYPTLIRIGNFPIHTYGVLIAIGFLLCVWVSKREAATLGISQERIVDLGFWSLLVGMLGARIVYIITRWSYYMEYPIEMLYLWEGGLVFYGGPLIALPFFIWYTDHYKLPRWKILDIGVQALPLAHAFGRLGCLSSGCCYGKPTNGQWGIVLHSELVEPASRGVYLHPTQLYESAALFLLFLFLRSRRKKKSFDGELMYLYLIIYPVIRFIIEIFRGDLIRGFVIDDILSTSQFISILVFLAALVAYIRKRRSL